MPPKYHPVLLLQGHVRLTPQDKLEEREEALSSYGRGYSVHIPCYHIPWVVGHLEDEILDEGEVSQD